MFPIYMTTLLQLSTFFFNPSKKNSFKLIFIIFLTLLTSNYLIFDIIYYNPPLNYNFYNNNLSISLISLSLFLNFLISMIEYKNKKMIYFNLMTLFCILFFLSNNFIYFYIFFESSLIPISLIILLHSSTFERFQALLYLILYTLLGSLPLLMSIFIFYKNFLSFQLTLPLMINFKPFYSFSSFIMLTLALMIKLPLFFYHSWLPKAHVQAPMTGSMFLAGILLKLGSFGLYLMYPLFFYSFFTIPISYLSSLTLLGSIFICLICLQQSDLKSLIAFSSVSHMNFMLCSMLTNNILSSSGALLLMLSHGLCSSHLFFLSYAPYNRYHSRNMYLISGSDKTLPVMIFIWFIFCALNMSAPPSMNFYGELLMVLSILKINISLSPFIILLSFSTACFSLFLFSNSFHNKSWLNFSFNNLNLLECLMSFAHFIPLIFFIFKINMFSLWVL